MREFEELWILTKNGLTLFNTKVEQTEKNVLFGGFLTAINQVANNLAKEDLGSIKIGKQLLVLYKNPNTEILVLGRSKKVKSEKRLHHLLESIYQLFEEQFGSILLKDFSGGNTFQFINFRTQLNEYFEDKTHKIDGMW